MQLHRVLHRRLERVPRRVDGRHRKPQGRGRRRSHHRRHPVDLGRPLRAGVDARRGVRDPDPDHGLPPAGPVRRGDEGGMSTVAATLRTNATNLTRLLPRWAWGLGFLALAVLYPSILDQLLTAPDDLL